MEQRGQARTLASGSLAQQAAQVTGLLAMLAIITVLARRLSLSELGAYGLLTSLAGYLLIVQNAAAGGAVRTMAAARDRTARDGAFSTAAVVYALAGIGAGVLIGALGVALSAGIDLPNEVRREAQLGAVLLGAVTALGWPLTVYRDALRADQRFVRAAVTEVGALLVYVALVLGLVYAGAPLAVVIAASGSIPLLAGLGCAAVARVMDLPFRFRRREVRATLARELLGVAGYLSLSEAAAGVIYALNRAILGLFRSAATVGLYEGPVRAHNLVRSLNAAVTVTALPTASRYEAMRDDRRLGELLLRGARYTLGLIVPLAVTGMVLAAPILVVWLGERFDRAAGAMAILLAHWLVNGCSGLLTATLVGVGRARQVARWAAAVAAADVALALALTPALGLEGIALATTLPYLALFPLLLRPALAAVPVGLGRLLREAVLPAYSLGAPLAAALAALRLTVPLEGLVPLLSAAIGALLLYWGAYYALWLDTAERRLVRDVARDLLPRRRAPTGA